METHCRHIAIIILSLLIYLPSCGNSGGNGDNAKDSTPGSSDTTILSDHKADDTRSADDVGGDQTVATDSQVPDLPSQPEVIPSGDKKLGEECNGDPECESGLCWRTSDASGCTFACTMHMECQAFGLVCAPLREGINGCVPPPPTGVQCTSHQECLYPSTCITEFNWCDLPECTFDGDCPDGQVCEAVMRKCQPSTCASSYECKNPLEFCLEDTCGPPQCTSSADCNEGEICSYAQGTCEEGTPCNEEGACNYYNQVCVNDLCEPNLCATPCATEGHICIPSTGKCGPPCTAISDCPAGWGCNPSSAACYENLAPMAKIAVDGKSPGVDVDAGSTITLDGLGSLDPEGESLLYHWLVLSKPPGASQETGILFCQQATCPLGPLSPGLYVVGLWVEDEVSVISPQTIMAIHAQ